MRSIFGEQQAPRYLIRDRDASRAARRAGLFDSVAGRPTKTAGFDAECAGRIDLLEHGNRAH